MITNLEKEKIIEILGKQFSRTIITHLTKKKIFNADGKEFSCSSIQKLVSGTQINPAVELEIVKFVAKFNTKKQKAQEARTNLLK